MRKPNDDMKEEQGMDESALMNRRHFLSRSVLAGAGLFLGLNQESWAVFATPSEIGQKLGIPTNWVEEMGRPLVEYAVYIQRHKLKNITVCQVIEPHTHVRGNVHNQIPPKSMWPSVTKVLRVTDRLSDYLGEKVGAIVSAYRSPAYNARCPGARSQSMHMRNMALDLKFKNSSPSRVAATAKAMRDRGMFSGGIGRYGSFTHVDTRGENVDW